MTNALVQKVWNFCNTLRDDGVGYGDYLEQLTYLLFLKMADEYTKEPYNRPAQMPTGYDWESLVSKSGAALETHYVDLLKKLGEESGMIGQIFFKAQNKIQDAAKLSKLIGLINAETWVMLGADVKGDIYEGLLQKNAEDTKSGAGQYFTPRALIQAMVECLRPQPMKTISDPSCGTGGFFLAAYDYIAKQDLNDDEKKFLKFHTFKGTEIVANTTRLCLMNLFLHNIGDLNSEPPVVRADSLSSLPAERFDFVLANPPFGKKSSVTISKDEKAQKKDEKEQKKESLVYERQDFWATTSNKQLNFVQHIRSMLKIDGQAAIVLPDNVLFEGGAGETVRKRLLESCDVHTILRLPTGIFYAQGVKANVIFFDNKPASKNPWTKELWIYDYRTNIKHSLKTNTLKFGNLEEFVIAYNPENRHKRVESERFKKFTYQEIIARDKTSLDIFWLKDDSLGDMENLPNPDILATEIVENLKIALSSFDKIVSDL